MPGVERRYCSGRTQRSRSPSDCGRARLTLGDAFSFCSGLYFRGKITYARRFAPEATLVITPTRGLQPPDTVVTADLIREFAGVDIASDDVRYREPLERDLRALAARLPAGARVVLLGSVATGKYVDVLVRSLGRTLHFPPSFVGRGDMSRGGLLLRHAARRRRAGLLGARAERQTARAAAAKTRSADARPCLARVVGQPVAGGAILPRDVEAFSDISGRVRRGGAGGIVARRAAAPGAGHSGRQQPTRGRTARSHGLLGVGGHRRLALANDDAAQRRFHQHPAERRGTPRGVPVGSEDGRVVQGLRRGGPDAHPDAPQHHLAGRRCAEGRERRRPADAAAAVRAEVGRRARDRCRDSRSPNGSRSASRVPVAPAVRRRRERSRSSPRTCSKDGCGKTACPTAMRPRSSSIGTVRRFRTAMSG